MKAKPETVDTAAVDQAVRLVTEVCERALNGDLEARVPVIGGSARAERIRTAINGLLDHVDAFVREAGAASAAASEGRFHRRFLTQGLDGAYRAAAEQITHSNQVMSRTAAQFAEAARQRQALADELESAVLTVSEQVATAATEMGRSANGLADFARVAVTDAERGLGTVSSLRTSSDEIRHAVDLINQVATNPGEIPNNGLDDDANGFVDDVHGWNFWNFNNNPADDSDHGTHTAGTMAAQGNNGIGVTGVGWNLKLLPLKIGSGNSVSGAQGVRRGHAVAYIGIRVRLDGLSGTVDFSSSRRIEASS